MSIQIAPRAQHPSFFRLSRGVIADMVLGALLLGPLAAPFLAAIGLFPLGSIANTIYFMGMYVCPQPELSVALMGTQLMAVCMRCYGTLLGLVIVRLFWAAAGGAGRWWLPQYGWRGATLMGLLILAYPFELALQVGGVWGFNNPTVTIFGLVTGVALGLFFVPVLYTCDPS